MKDTRTVVIKRFDELTTRELYEILRLRCDIFVVEQVCPYPDIDGKDYEALHFAHFDADGKALAYLRVYEDDVEPNVMWIGRVVTTRHRSGLGRIVMTSVLEELQQTHPGVEIRLNSQCQASGFYAKFGFVECSETFQLDDQPHVRMRLRLTSGEN